MSQWTSVCIGVNTYVTILMDQISLSIQAKYTFNFRNSSELKY